MKPKACLTIQRGNETGRQYVIRAGQQFVIGRSHGCAIPLNDGAISRHHTSLELTSKGLQITDLSSRNGTVLDGKKLIPNEAVYACPNDVLEVGAHIFSVEILGLSKQTENAVQRTRRTPRNFLPTDEFELLGEVGRGATGIVYGARQKALQRNVAIKVPRLDVEDYDECRARFIREGQLCSKISSPYVVTVYDMRLLGKKVFIVMEMVNGGSAQDRITSTRFTSKRIPIQEIARMGEHIGLALHAIHRHKIIHRDLKPSNILLSPEGISKLADFGIAKQLGDASKNYDSMTGSDEGLGTLGYISPEAASTDDLGAYSDIYSLGATLYHMLTNQILFVETDLNTTLMRIIEEKPTPIKLLRPDCPSEMTFLVESMLAKNPAERPQDALEIAIKLGKIANKLTPEARLLASTDQFEQNPSLQDSSYDTDAFF